LPHEVVFRLARERRPAAAQVSVAPNHMGVFTETPPLRAVYFWTVMLHDCRMCVFIKHFPSEGPLYLEPSG